jgi:hypothetical protein
MRTNLRRKAGGLKNLARHGKKALLSVQALLGIALGAAAQDKAELSTDAKIDSIFRMEQKIYSAQNINPLQDKKFGFEINPVRFFFMDQYPGFSGMVSLFNVNRHAEIANISETENPGANFAYILEFELFKIGWAF